MKWIVGSFVLLSLLAAVACGGTPAATSPLAEPTVTPTMAVIPSIVGVGTPAPAELAKNRILANAEQEDVYGDKLLPSTSQYQLSYIDKDDYFVVLLLSTPLSEARKAAEEALLQMSDNNLEGLCALQVDIGAPMYVQRTTEEVVEHPHVLDLCILGK